MYSKLTLRLVKSFAKLSVWLQLVILVIACWIGGILVELNTDQATWLWWSVVRLLALLGLGFALLLARHLYYSIK